MTQSVSAVSAALFVALTLVLPVFMGGFAFLNLLVAAIAALAFIVGAWLAPASYRGGASGSLVGWGRSPRPVSFAGTKIAQLVIGGLAVLATVMIFRANPGTAAIVGIAVAIGVGALAPAGATEGRDRV